MNYNSSSAKAVEQVQSGELQSLVNQITEQRVMYGDLLYWLSNIGHKIEDTNYPQAENDIKKMSDTTRPGIIYDLKTQSRLFQEQNESLLSLVNKFEKLV